MTVKSKKHYMVWVWALIPFLDIITYFIRPEGFYIAISIFKVVVYALIASAFFVYWEKRAVLFESTDRGIWIKGAKEGLYDPDFIKYEEILSCDYDKKLIHLTLKDDRFVTLKRLNKKNETCYNEIMKNIDK